MLQRGVNRPGWIHITDSQNHSFQDAYARKLDRIRDSNFSPDDHRIIMVWSTLW